MSAEANKQAVRRFNTEVIENGSADAFATLMAPGFVNHTAPPGAPNGPEGMWATFDKVLRPAFSDLRVTIHEQLADDDKVITRKTISGIHEGPLFGLAPTGRRVSIDVIDIVRLEGGRYAEHWGINTLPALLAELRRG